MIMIRYMKENKEKKKKYEKKPYLTTFVTHTLIRRPCIGKPHPLHLNFSRNGFSLSFCLVHRTLCARRELRRLTQRVAKHPVLDLAQEAQRCLAEDLLRSACPRHRTGLLRRELWICAKDAGGVRYKRGTFAQGGLKLLTATSTSVESVGEGTETLPLCTPMDLLLHMNVSDLL